MFSQTPPHPFKEEEEKKKKKGDWMLIFAAFKSQFVYRKTKWKGK